MKPKKIFLVFKTHFDIGFTHLASEVIENYSKKLLPSVISTVAASKEYDETRPYVWTMSAWPLFEILRSNHTTEENKKTAARLIDEGALAWHMLPFTTHTNFCGVEEFIRGMYFSQQMANTYGKEILSAKMTDVTGHSWLLPSLLNGAGVKFLHLGCNPSCMPPAVPRLFFWQGPDGKRVLTFYNKGAYGSDPLPPDDWKYPVWLALMSTGDNLGPHSPKDVERIIEHVQKNSPGTEVILGTMDDFYRELEKCDLSDLPVISKDLGDTWIHGTGSYPKETALLRRTRHSLACAEAAAALYGTAPNLADEANAAYENGILFGEHTFGLDVKITLGGGRAYEKEAFLEQKSLPSYKRMEASWAEKAARQEGCTSHAEALISAAEGTLAAAVPCNGAHITLFFASGISHPQWVSLAKFKEQLAGKTLALASTGEALPTRTNNGTPEVYIKTPPKLGHLTLTLAPAAQSAEASQSRAPASFETPYYTVIPDLHIGGLSSLIEKKTGKEWVNAAVAPLFSYRYDVYGSDDITEFMREYTYRFFDWSVNDLGRMGYPETAHGTFVPRVKDVQLCREGALTHLTFSLAGDAESAEKYGDAKSIKLQLTFYNDTPDIDIALTLLEKQETPFVESGSILFPFALNNPEVLLNTMGHTMNLAKDVVDDGNHVLYSMDNRVALADAQHAAMLYSKDSHLLGVGDTGLVRYRRTYNFPTPTLYCSLFNNTYGTNFPQWMSGDFSYQYRLSLGASTDYSNAACDKAAAAFVKAPIASFAEASVRDAILPLDADLLSACEDFTILAVKRPEDGEGLILRLQDIGGTERQTVLRFANPLQKATLCNLMERDTKELCCNTDSIPLSVKPYEIITLRIVL